jgi:hypothetical protein
LTTNVSSTPTTSSTVAPNNILLAGY